MYHPFNQSLDFFEAANSRVWPLRFVYSSKIDLILVCMLYVCKPQNEQRAKRLDCFGQEKNHSFVRHPQRHISAIRKKGNKNCKRNPLHYFFPFPLFLFRNSFLLDILDPISSLGIFSLSYILLLFECASLHFETTAKS